MGFVDINWDLGFESVTRDIGIFSKFPPVIWHDIWANKSTKINYFKGDKIFKEEFKFHLILSFKKFHGPYFLTILKNNLLKD